MLVVAAKLYSDQGVPLPRHREITLHYTGIGVFTMREQYEKDFRRTLRVATLRPIDGVENVLPPLYDAAIVWVGDGEIRVRGFEINPTTMAHVAMAWGAEILEDQRPSRLLALCESTDASSVISSQEELESAGPWEAAPRSGKR